MPTNSRMLDAPTFCRSEHSDCMRAAIANGINLYRRDEAERFLSLGPIPDERFGTVNNFLRSHGMRYNLQHCDIGTNTPDAWAMDRPDGIFLLVLKGSDRIGDEVEHVVVIDAGTRTIIDSCEPTVLRLTWDVLQRCVGDTTYRGAIGIRQLCRQEEGSSRKNPLRKQSKKKTHTNRQG